jgi:hypothetical protein
VGIWVDGDHYGEGRGEGEGRAAGDARAAGLVRSLSAMCARPPRMWPASQPSPRTVFSARQEHG